MRILRDPVGTIILFGLPMVLLVVFGAFMSNTDSLSLDTGFVDSSGHPIGSTIKEALRGTGVFELPPQSGTDRARDAADTHAALRSRRSGEAVSFVTIRGRSASDSRPLGS